MTARSLLLLLLGTAPLPAFAQDQPVPPSPSSAVAPVPERKLPSKNRPTIGVALEGGGALGEAHVGVLKWFEDHHIPVDYLGGTSMGGLVAGFYASGKSADDIHGVLKSADWPLLLGGETPYEDLSFRRKEDAREFPTSIIIGLNLG